MHPGQSQASCAGDTLRSTRLRATFVEKLAEPHVERGSKLRQLGCRAVALLGRPRSTCSSASFSTRSSEAAALSIVRMPASFPATIEVRPRRTLGEMFALGAVR